MNPGELCESVKFLCDSPQRLRILNVLAERQMDVRELMRALDSPRSTLQHNLTVLEDRGCVEQTRSGYVRTTVGGLLQEEFIAVSETTATIKRMAPFFKAVDTPPEIDIGKLIDAVVTTPDLAHPNAPIKRLFDTFAGADRIYGFVPVISGFIIELFHDANESGTANHEYVLSQTAFDAIRTQCGTERTDGSKTILPGRIEVSIYENDIPYGLFVSEDRLALTAYTEIGRVQALVESTSEEAIEWGEGMYETYRREAIETKTNILSVVRNVELVD